MNRIIQLFLVLSFTVLGTFAMHNETLENIKINKQDQLGNELCAAVLEGNVQRCKGLIKQGAPLEYIDNKGNTPLYYSFENCPLQGLAGNHLTVFRLLIQAGALVPQEFKEREEVLFSIFGAMNTMLVREAKLAQYEDIKGKIKAGADVNFMDEFGHTALHYISGKGDIPCLKLLIEEGADVNAHRADTMPHLGNQIRRPGPPRPYNERNAYVGTPLCHAISHKHTEVAEILIRCGADVNKFKSGDISPLALAVKSGNYVMVDLVLHAGAAVNALCILGRPLHVITNYAKIFDPEYILQILSLLREWGADCNLVDISHETPLHYAACGDSDWVGKLLISFGAHVNAHDNNFRTPLHRAVMRGSETNCKLLLKAGSDALILNDKGIAPLNLVKHEIVKTMLRLSYFWSPALENSRTRIFTIMSSLRQLPPYVRINVMIQDPFVKRDVINFLLCELRDGNPEHWLIFHALKEELIEHLTVIALKYIDEPTLATLNPDFFEAHQEIDIAAVKNEIRTGLDERASKLKTKAKQKKNQTPSLHNNSSPSDS